MATLPVDEHQDHRTLRPAPVGDASGVRLDRAIEPDRLVKTHCCFCGQQCGIQLKVKDNEVIGFEPWEEFPFNRGMLCPKGVKRYLQGSHPDRLLTALRRDPIGGRRLPRDARTTRRSPASAAEIDRLQQAHGPSSVGVLGGASLTTEKTYLMGKFARVCLKTPYIDYNGRLCMVSAGAANKKAFGIDRTTNPWSDMVGTDVIWIAGSNVAECSPITTNYIWQAREHGAKIIVQDPRITPIARTCDLFLPVKPGRDAALFAGVLHLMIEHDWLDHDFIDAHTVGFDAVAEYCRAVDAGADGRGDRRAGAVDPPGRRVVGDGEDELPAPRARHRAPLQRRAERARHDQPGARLRPHRQPKSGYGTIVGQAQRTGRARARPEVRSAPGLARHRESGAPALHRAASGASTSSELPGPGVDAYEMFRKIDAGEIQGLLSICFNPKVSLPDNHFVTRCLEKLEFYVGDRLLPERHGAPRRHRAARVACTRRTRARSRRSRGASSRSTRPSTARARRGRTGGSSRTSPRRSAGRTGSPSRARARSSRSCGVASKGGVADYSGITYEKIERADGRVLALLQRGSAHRVSRSTIPGTPRLFEPGSYNPVAKGAGPFYFPDGKARFNVADYRPPVDDVDEEYPIFLTTGRVVSQFLSGTQTRRIGPLVEQYPGAARRDAPAAGREARHQRRRLDDGRDAGAARITLRAHGRDDDPARHGLHPLSLGRARRASTG